MASQQTDRTQELCLATPIFFALQHSTANKKQDKKGEKEGERQGEKKNKLPTTVLGHFKTYLLQKIY